MLGRSSFLAIFVGSSRPHGDGKEVRNDTAALVRGLQLKEERLPDSSEHRTGRKSAPRVTISVPVNPTNLDDGIMGTVLLLWAGGFRTFTSCEGGKGHSFRYGTVGLALEGAFPDFQRRLLGFLRSNGMQNFTISLVTDFCANCPEGRSCVYVEGLDLLSEDKRERSIRSIKRKERKLRREAAAEGFQ